MSDFAKVVDVIKSCKTSAQNDVAYRMVCNYDKKYPQNSIITMELMALIDQNLYDILARAGQ